MKNFVGQLVVGSVIFILILSLGSTAAESAEPLGLLTLESHADETIARDVLGSAYARIGNRFLVSASLSQQAILARNGLEFELLMDEVDPHEVYRVYSLDHPRAPELIDLRQFGEPIDLGRGLRIMKLTRATAASISDMDQMQATSLTDLDIRFLYLPPAVPAAIEDDYPTDSLASRINQDSLLAYVQRLQDFQTRYAYTDSCVAAREWIAQKFRDWGYTMVTTPLFYFNGWHANVRVIKQGTVEPDKIIVIGGHYDSVVRNDQYPGRYEYAPGANDDGSGTALTMEVARILADVPLRKTVIFIPFAAEEIGLVGSSHAAWNFASAGAKLEVMYNFDMVGNTEDDIWDINLSSGDVFAYRNFSAATAYRVSELIPLITSPGGSSDHASFEQAGFNIVNHIETDFSPNWHYNTDLVSEMNFEYLTEVTKMAAVSLAIVADAAYPVEVDGIIDPGDGHSLVVAWSDCSADCDYTVYWGTESGVYTDSASVPSGECSYTLEGLLDEVPYVIYVVGESPYGYRALYGVEGTGTPRLFPRAPGNLVGSVSGEQLRLSISWDASQELDFSHYNIYRRIGSVGALNLYRSGYTGTSFTDNETVAHVGYEYSVTAVDYDGNESEPAVTEMLFPASFDGGPVMADGFTQDHFYDPDQAWQEAWLDTVLGGIGFGVASSDEHGGPVTLAGVGQYSSLFWIDDDVIIKNIGASEAALDDFAANNTNMFICGYRTWVGWSPQSVPTNHMLYREFGLSYYAYTGYFDFVGAHGENGWPSVQIDPTRGMNEWRDIPKLSPRPGATVIGTFDSFEDRPDWEGQPVGLAYESSNGKRVLLSFPLYYLTPTSAQALMAKVIEYFGVTGQHDKGDLDHSGTIDIVDLVILLDHLFISLQPLPDPAEADMDGRPGVSIGDAFYLINYLFLGGPAPVPSTGGGD